MSHGFSKYPVLAALDVGSSKVCCLIAHISRDQRIQIAGYGYNASNGIKNGVVTDINHATLSVCNAVEDAEQKANHQIDELFVNVSGDKTKSILKHSQIQLHKNRPISDADIQKLVMQSQTKMKLQDTDVIHCIPMNYTVNKNNIVSDPRKLLAETLGLDMLFGYYPSLLHQNLKNIVENAHLDVSGSVFSGYASALSCLVDDEKELGATVIDIGGGTTSITTFKNKFPIYFSTIPVGGNNITNDIAWGLTTSFAHAEDLKIRHGCAIPIGQDEYETIDVYPVGEEDDNSIRQVPKSMLINIIQPRVEEMFEMINLKLAEAGLKDVPNHRVVLTGGCSLLSCIREVASEILNKQVRLGLPRNIANIPPYLYDPKYSTVLGMLLFALNAKECPFISGTNTSINMPDMNGLKRIFGWFKHNF